MIENVVKLWNRANSGIFFGKGGDIATNSRDEQELSVLCLRVLLDGGADRAQRRGDDVCDDASQQRAAAETGRTVARR